MIDFMLCTCEHSHADHDEKQNVLGAFTGERTCTVDGCTCWQIDEDAETDIGYLDDTSIEQDELKEEAA